MTMPSSEASAACRTGTLGYTHATILSNDLDVSERFYIDVFKLEPLPHPNFGFDVRWLRLGDLQLHLQYTDQPIARTFQHFGIEVGDFLGTYRALSERNAFDDDNRYAWIWRLPSDELQMFCRDPFGNMIEVNARPGTDIDASELARPERVLADEVTQGPENAGARLFMPCGHGHA